jgi:predicted HicB family RNase H-like nuclease
MKEAFIMMTYKNYMAKVVYDDDANIFHGEVINIRDVITFEGSSVLELQNSFKESIDDYLDFCNSRGEEPNLAINGFLSLNIPVSNQNMLRNAAKKAGKDFEEWAIDALNKQALLYT